MNAKPSSPNSRPNRQQISAKARAIIEKCVSSTGGDFFVPAPVDAVSPALTMVDDCLPVSRSRKTNPNPVSSPAPAAAAPSTKSERQLSPRQLAAARFIAAGVKPTDVAGKLRISRQGLWKWRRMPSFAAELRRMHELLVRELGR